MQERKAAGESEAGYVDGFEEEEDDKRKRRKTNG